MKDNFGFKILIAGLVPAIALGILAGADVASKKAVEFTETLMVSNPNILENSSKGSGKADTVDDILKDYKAYLEREK